jgi:cytochrome P450
MPSATILAAIVGGIVLILHRFIYIPFFSGPLSRIPGGPLYAISKWRLAIEDWRGTRTRTINNLHEKYGPVVRVGPNEVAFNSLSALRTIYGAGSGSERTPFYDMFDAYGKKNLFTFYSPKDHGDRKKLLAHAYSKSVMLKGATAAMVEDKVHQYLQLMQQDPTCTAETFTSLHYFSLDAISDFLYGDFGKTRCLEGNNIDRTLLEDIVDIARRKLSWFAVHFPAFTKWLYTRKNLMEKVVRNFYPMKQPTTYTGIRAHALQAWQTFQASPQNVKATARAQESIIGKLWKHHKSQKSGGLGDLDVASECADHLLAGIDTTSDTLMFLIWAISRSENVKYQERLRAEVRAISKFAVNEKGITTVNTCDKLPFLDAVIKETLRLYAPLPASEPRSFPIPTTIDGYLIPARTVVSMSPFSLHRNPAVFRDPLTFDPDRWLGDELEVAELKKWFWAFSSGGRMCIGIQ